MRFSLLAAVAILACMFAQASCSAGAVADHDAARARAIRSLASAMQKVLEYSNMSGDELDKLRKESFDPWEKLRNLAEPRTTAKLTKENIREYEVAEESYFAVMAICNDPVVAPLAKFYSKLPKGVIDSLMSGKEVFFDSASTEKDWVIPSYCNAEIISAMQQHDQIQAKLEEREPDPIVNRIKQVNVRFYTEWAFNRVSLNATVGCYTSDGPPSKRFFSRDISLGGSVRSQLNPDGEDSREDFPRNAGGNTFNEKHVTVKEDKSIIPDRLLVPLQKIIASKGHFSLDQLADAAATLTPKQLAELRLQAEKLKVGNLGEWQIVNETHRFYGLLTPKQRKKVSAEGLSASELSAVQMQSLRKCFTSEAYPELVPRLIGIYEDGQRMDKPGLPPMSEGVHPVAVALIRMGLEDVEDIDPGPLPEAVWLSDGDPSTIGEKLIGYTRCEFYDLKVEFSDGCVSHREIKVPIKKLGPDAKPLKLKKHVDIQKTRLNNHEER